MPPPKTKISRKPVPKASIENLLNPVKESTPAASSSKSAAPKAARSTPADVAAQRNRQPQIGELLSEYNALASQLLVLTEQYRHFDKPDMDELTPSDMRARLQILDMQVRNLLHRLNQWHGHADNLFIRTEYPADTDWVAKTKTLIFVSHELNRAKDAASKRAARLPSPSPPPKESSPGRLERPSVSPMSDVRSKAPSPARDDGSPMADVRTSSPGLPYEPYPARDPGLEDYSRRIQGLMADRKAREREMLKVYPPSAAPTASGTGGFDLKDYLSKLSGIVSGLETSAAPPQGRAGAPSPEAEVGGSAAKFLKDNPSMDLLMGKGSKSGSSRGRAGAPSPEAEAAGDDDDDDDDSDFNPDNYESPDDFQFKDDDNDPKDVDDNSLGVDDEDDEMVDDDAEEVEEEDILSGFHSSGDVLLAGVGQFESNPATRGRQMAPLRELRPADPRTSKFHEDLTSALQDVRSDDMPRSMRRREEPKKEFVEGVGLIDAEELEQQMALMRSFERQRQKGGAEGEYDTEERRPMGERERKPASRDGSEQRFEPKRGAPPPPDPKYEGKGKGKAT